MALSGELGKELPCASAAQPRGHRDRVAAGGLLGHWLFKDALWTLPRLHSTHVEDRDCNL